MSKIASFVDRSLGKKALILNKTGCLLYYLNTFRYVQLPAEEIDTQLLQDASRKENVTSTR